jgi:hypothetical protein
MFFTHLGRVVAILALVAGIWSITLGVMIATESLGPYADALARYAPRKSSSGEVIDRGIYTVLFAIALGILTEISRSVRALTKTQE